MRAAHRRHVHRQAAFPLSDGNHAVPGLPRPGSCFGARGLQVHAHDQSQPDQERAFLAQACRTVGRVAPRPGRTPGWQEAREAVLRAHQHLAARPGRRARTHHQGDLQGGGLGPCRRALPPAPRPRRCLSPVPRRWPRRRHGAAEASQDHARRRRHISRRCRANISAA